MRNVRALRLAISGAACPGHACVRAPATAAGMVPSPPSSSPTTVARRRSPKGTLSSVRGVSRWRRDDSAFMCGGPRPSTESAVTLPLVGLPPPKRAGHEGCASQGPLPWPISPSRGDQASTLGSLAMSHLGDALSIIVRKRRGSRIGHDRPTSNRDLILACPRAATGAARRPPACPPPRPGIRRGCSPSAGSAGPSIRGWPAPTPCRQRTRG